MPYKFTQYLLPLLILILLTSNNSIEAINKSKKTYGTPRTLKVKGIPLLWFDQNTILFSEDQSIIKYDFVNELELGRINTGVEKGSVLLPDSSCFNQKKLFLIFEKNYSENSNSKLLKQTKKIIDITPNFDVKNIDTPNSGVPNFECNISPLFSHKTGLSNYFKTKENNSLHLSTSQFIEAKYISSRESIKKVEGLIESLSFKAEPYTWLDSDYDRSKSMYLWYLRDLSFDKSYKYWPTKAWWADIKNHKITEVQIPAGPWVTNYSLMDWFQDFARGCVYDWRIRLHASNGQIFAQVYGDAVENKAQGIYHLVYNKSSQWVKIIGGNLDYKPLLSSDGCRIIYSIKAEIKLLDICK